MFYFWFWDTKKKLSNWDYSNWEKRKILMDSSKSGGTVAILKNSSRDETLKVTFSIDDSTANIDTAYFKLFVIYSKFIWLTLKLNLCPI